jgi:hypothetical protein
MGTGPNAPVLQIDLIPGKFEKGAGARRGVQREDNKEPHMGQDRSVKQRICLVA